MFITRKYPPSVGGMELFAFELSRSIAEKADLQLVKWTGSGRVKAVLVALPYLFVRSFWQLLRGRADVIHAQDGVVAPMAYLLAKMFRVPYTVQIHGLDITYKNPIFRTFVPAAVRRAEVIFCISQAAADQMLAAGFEDGKIRVIPLAASDVLHGKAEKEALLSELGLDPYTPTLLTVGRLVRRKGVAWFIETVLPGLVKDYPKLVYLVAGQGEERANIERTVKKMRLGGNVRLLGRVDDGLRLALYNGADVFVMPNINVPDDMEGFGLVLLEAALCGRPIVAADTEGIKDAVHNGKNGVLVPVESASGFSEEIRRFLDDRSYAEGFGRSARRFTLDNYNWSKVAEQYIKLYKSL